MVWQAYKEVRSTKSSSGIDGMTWAWLEKNSRTALYKLWNRLTSGSYFPQAVKEVSIPKKQGGVRLLGIPTILDRVAQQVVKAHLELQCEPHFHASSFGYRPKKSCHDAIAQACNKSFNHDFVIDLDIKSFFDTINHDLLMQAVAHFCKDKWVLLYVNRWLKADIIKQDKQLVERLTGTPQGGVISPLLANIFMHVCFDKWMDNHHPEKPFERYADDIVVHCKTEKQAQFVLSQIRTRLAQCKLELHPTKTKIINLRGKAEKQYRKSFDFLGFTIKPNWCKVNKRWMLIPSIFISTKSVTGILTKFQTMQLHKRRRPLEELATMLRPVTRGIINYYGKFSTGHLRYIWKQLNTRLLKWIKWQKGLSKGACVNWLRKKYKAHPTLFAHWKLVHP